MRKIGTISLVVVSALAIATGVGRTAAAVPTTTIGLVRSVEPGDDRGNHGQGKDDLVVTAPATPTSAPTAEPRDDKGGQGELEPGDDNGGANEAEPADDKGGANEAEPADDKGGATQAEPGDDKGGQGHGTDDGAVAPAPTGTAQPADDKGGSNHAEPGDDNGGSHGGHGSDD